MTDAEIRNFHRFMTRRILVLSTIVVLALGIATACYIRITHQMPPIVITQQGEGEIRDAIDLHKSDEETGIAPKSEMSAQAIADVSAQRVKEGSGQSTVTIASENRARLPPDEEYLVPSDVGTGGAGQ